MMFPIVPSWTSIPLRYRGTRHRDMAGERTEVLPMLSLSAFTGLEVKAYETESHRRTQAESASYWVVEPGDVVLNPMWIFKGAVASSRLSVRGTVSPAYVVLRPTKSHDARFIAYQLKSKPMLDWYSAEARGETTYDRAVRWDTLSSLPLPAPSVKDQQQVVDFLDRECERIAALASSTGRLSTALEAAWQERLEETLLASDIRRLRFWGSTVQLGPFGSALKSDEYVAEQVPLINPIHINWRGIRPSPDVTITEARANSLAQWRMKPRDVVVARRGELGRAAVVSDDQAGYMCGTGSAVIRAGGRLDPHFLVLVLLTRAARDHLALAASGSTMPNLATDALMELPVELLSNVVDEVA